MEWYCNLLNTTSGNNLTSSTSTSIYINPYCNNATTTSSSTVIYQAWAQQNQNQAAELYQGLQHVQQQYQPAAPAIIRPEAEAAQREHLRAHEEEQRRRHEVREAANKRAEELMLAHLTPAQRLQIKAHGWFIVEGGRSKHNYMIRPTAYAGNIEVTEWDGRRSRLCCHVDHSIPVFDNALAQKLMLEHDEDAFLRIANRTAA